MIIRSCVLHIRILNLIWSIDVKSISRLFDIGDLLPKHLAYVYLKLKNAHLLLRVLSYSNSQWLFSQILTIIYIYFAVLHMITRALIGIWKCNLFAFKKKRVFSWIGGMQPDVMKGCLLGVDFLVAERPLLFILCPCPS